MLLISRFQVENSHGRVVTDKRNPEFSFALESDRTENALKSAVLCVNNWKIETKEQTGIVYRGNPLEPMRTYEAKLTVEDRYGECAEATLTFETGKGSSPWKGAWITDAAYRFTERKVSPKPMTFRRKLTLPSDKKIASAKLYITALGVMLPMLDGEKIGEDFLAPGFTSYRYNLQYMVYELGTRIHRDSVIDVVVAGGWAVGSYTYFRRNRVYGDKQALLAELWISYEDGSHEVIGTDESWLVTEDGNYREADLYDGEVCDATVDLDQVHWKKAAAARLAIAPELSAMYGTPVRAHERLTPKLVTRTKSGELIYDMGQNFAGVIYAEMEAKAGQHVVFRHAEILDQGELCTEPLRSAKQRAEYICRDGHQSYMPQLTYMGFRYVGVTGIDEDALTLMGVALYSDVNATGGFSCSNEAINRLQEAIRWGAKSNFVDIPTDCPQRDERLGWTGDIALFSPTACFNFDMSRFFEKWLLDVKKEQSSKGGIPTIVPQVKIYKELSRNNS